MTAYPIRAHLFALSNLYRRSQESELVPLGFNPVAALMDKPAIARKEARWLEVHDASLLLESARWLPSVVTAAGEAIGAAVAISLPRHFLSDVRPPAAAAPQHLANLSISDAGVTVLLRLREASCLTDPGHSPACSQVEVLLEPDGSGRIVTAREA